MLDAYIVQTNDIEFTVKEKPLQNVSDATSAKAAWDTLAERYEGKGKQRGVHLINEIFRTAFTDSEPLDYQVMIGSSISLTTRENTLPLESGWNMLGDSQRQATTTAALGSSHHRVEQRRVQAFRWCL